MRWTTWIWIAVGAWMALRGLAVFRQCSRAARRSSGRPVRRALPKPRRPRLFPPRSQFVKPLPERTQPVVAPQPPYSFAYRGTVPGTALDLSQDGDADELRRRGLPVLATPDDVARWLELPVNRLAWLAHRCTRGRPESGPRAHYHYVWLPKRTGGHRLLECPKRDLRAIQRRILVEILQKVPTPDAAHGFVRGRSIATNAAAHVRPALLLKFDLRDFYPSVGFGRVVAIFRRLGYSREAALWLARLTTSALPANLPFPSGDPEALWRYRRRHLPQGAPTSPALANLSAYRLDKRLAGLARSFGATYTRYADDLTLSGDAALSPRLRVLIPLVEQVIRAEGFHSQRSKRRVLRAHQRQVVTGVVVNERPNVVRRDYDRLKAILHNCVVHGPSTQNRARHPQFAEHLRGRIAHVQQLHPERGQRLLEVYNRIDWRR